MSSSMLRIDMSAFTRGANSRANDSGYSSRHGIPLRPRHGRAGIGGVRRVGLVLDQILTERDGRYSTDEVVIRFVEELAAPAFDRIEFCSRVRRAAEDAPYVLDPARFDVLPLPWYASVPELCLKSPV